MLHALRNLRADSHESDRRQRRHKTYTKGAVSVEAKDLTSTIDRASFVAFIGPLGSGKTTLLNLIGALDQAELTDDHWVLT